MPAEFDTGFTVREPAWHGLGHVLNDYPVDWAEARHYAGLEWEPEMAPVFAGVPGAPAVIDGEVFTWPDGSPVLGDTTYEEVPTHRIVRRSDSKAVLGVVGRQFTPVTHEQMGEVVEAILDQPSVQYVTAGSLMGGALVWCLARLDEPEYVAGDDSPTYPYLVALNGHDGATAFKVMPTSIRVVCWNTYRAAEMEGARSGRQFTFRHTAGVTDRIEEAKAAVNGTREAASDWVALANGLSAMPAREHEWARFVNEFIPDPSEHAGNVISDRVKANVERNRAQLSTLIAASPSTDGHRGTALGLVDAAVEYLDYLRGYRSSDTLFGRTLLRPEPLKARAVSLAREVCTVG